MKIWIALLFSLAGSILWTGPAPLAEEGRPFKPDWLAVSDREELRRTWSQALVFLPERFGRQSGRLLAKGPLFAVLPAPHPDDLEPPTILYLHACEGLGHHREDLRRLARLGFVVIAPDSFARKHRPLGCDEERERFIKYFDIAIAFQKAELDYAVQRMKEFSWIDRRKFFLMGSGMGGMVVAQYQGTDFAGHLIEGWGCRGPNPVFDGIWAPKGVRIFSSVSRNDPWYQKNPGFGVDCKSFLEGRPHSVSVILSRPAHYVSWYPKSRTALIRFLTKDMDIDSDLLAADVPAVIKSSPDAIELQEKWSNDAVHTTARKHCAGQGKTSRLIAEPQGNIYSFVCE